MEKTKNSSLITVKEFTDRFTSLFPVPPAAEKIYKIIKDPSFPSVKIGSRYYVVTEAAEKWLSSLLTSQGGEQA